MRIYKYIFVCMLSLPLAACIGGIDTYGNGGTLTVTLQADPSNGANDLAWESDGTDFTIVRDGDDLPSTSDFTFQDDDVNNGNRYCYQVRATDLTPIFGPVLSSVIPHAHS